MTATVSEREGGEIVRLQVDGAWADVALFGSTVIGWHPSSYKQNDASLIFLSKDTKPGKAYRGGIPIVFPVFGEVKDHGDVPAPIQKCGRHGFCRDRPWSLTGRDSADGKASVTMTLTSKDNPTLLEMFPCPFVLHHIVTLTADTLQTSLRVQHLESSENDVMPFHALFHTYLGLPSATAQASGLRGVAYKDKVAGKTVIQNDVEHQGWDQEIDRVYEGRAEQLTISANDDSGVEIKLERTETLPDTTLWNPGQGADESMGDLHAGGWREFVCAEPGHVSSFASLEKGKEWIGTQTLTFSYNNGNSPQSTKATKVGAAVGGAAVAGAAASSGSAVEPTTTKNTDAKQDGDATADRESAAALLIQRRYRSYVSRREEQGLRLSPDARWGEAVGRARLDGAHKDAFKGDKNDASSRWKRGGLLVGQLAGSPHTNLEDTAPVEGGPSLEPSPSLDAAMQKSTTQKSYSREESKGVVGDVPGANDDGKVDNIRSIADKNQYGLKVIERWTRGAPAQELSKVMEAQYWLEMVDRKHRYGSNLKHYHAAWENDTTTKDNFFKWLDEGNGKDLSLPELPREQLEKEQVTYLSSEQRANYIVDVKDGRLVWRRNGKFVDTTNGRWRDLGRGQGIVELGEEEQAELRRQREERAARKGKKLKGSDATSSSSSSSSSSDDEPIDSEEEESEKQRARHYGGDEPKHKRGLKALTPAGTWDKLLRKTVRDNTWIYVYNSRHELFVGIKTTGKFQHSSFLYGGRVLSAGLLKARKGYLTSLSPLSGHYRAGSAHFRFFVASLQDSGVELSKVTLSKSLLMLHGLEAYGKMNKKMKEKKTKAPTEKDENKDDRKKPTGSDGLASDKTEDGLSSKLHRFSLRKVFSSKSNTDAPASS